jgi:hypothetical protein
MADIILDTQVPPSTPGANTGVVFVDSVSKQGVIKNDTGRAFSLPGEIRNWNTADVTANAVDTYITGSNLSIPAHLMQVGTTFRWKFVLTKTAAGVAAPIWVVRVGTAGSAADTARLTFTQVAAQTAAVDAGVYEIDAVLRNVGAAGVLAGGLRMNHVLATTGLSTLGANVQQVTSAGFDTTVASTIVGVSVNPGALGVFTIQVVSAQALNL